MPVQPQADKFSIDYSLGQVSGHVALDTVSLGQPPTRVTQQAMGLATASTADFSTTSCDGVFVSLLRQASGSTFFLVMVWRQTPLVSGDCHSQPLRIAVLAPFMLYTCCPLCHQL